LVDIISASSKESEVSPSTGQIRRLKTEGTGYSKKFSGGEAVTVSKKKTMGPRRKDAGNLSIIREESNLSVDNESPEYSFFK